MSSLCYVSSSGDSLGPGEGSTVFPNTDSYSAGYISENGIVITVNEQMENGDITFEVSGLGAAPEGYQFPEPATNPPISGESAGTTETDAETATDTEPPATDTGTTETDANSTETETGSPETTTPESSPETTAPEASPETTAPESSPEPATDAAAPTPSPVTVPATDGGSTTAPPVVQTSPPRWVLSRPPSPERQPGDLPEFPVEAPGSESVLKSSGMSNCKQWLGSVLFALGAFWFTM